MKILVYGGCLAFVVLSNVAAAQTPDAQGAYTAEPAMTEERVDNGVTTLGRADAPDEPDLPEGGAPYTAPDARPRKPYDLLFRLSGTTTYDDNIFIQNRHTQSDVISGLSGGLTLGVGDAEKKTDSYLIGSYDISPFFFARHSSLDSIDHDASLRAQWHGSRLTLGGVFHFLDLTGGDKDAGDRVNRKIYDADVTIVYVYGEKTRLGVDLRRLQTTDYQRQIDRTETSAGFWADYQLTPLIATGVGLTFGYVEVQNSGSQTYEQLTGRANYALASKVNAGLNAGVEFRQVDNRQANVTPVFSLEADYSPYDLLRLSITGYRRVLPSIISRRENTTVTGLSFAVRERFLQKCEATLTGGYEHTEYHSEGSNVTFSPTEDYLFGRLNVSYILTERWRLGVFYELHSNHSTENIRSFDQHQTGLNVSYNF